MTESTWPNVYDQNLVNITEKNSHGELDIKKNILFSCELSKPQ